MNTADVLPSAEGTPQDTADRVPVGLLLFNDPALPFAAMATNEAAAKTDTAVTLAAATTGPLVVTTTADVVDAGDGQTSLREALALANSGTDADGDGSANDTITFAAGVGQAFAQGGVIVLGGTELTISSDVTIVGDVDGDGTPDVTISGNGQSRVLDVASGAAVLRGLTISDGAVNASSYGAGLRVGEGAQATVRDSRFEGNSAGFGGAIANVGRVDISGSYFVNNRAMYGGAISNYTGMTIGTSTFAANTGTYGGGAVSNFGTLAISNGTFANNFADGDGGAILNFADGALSILNSTLTGNSASEDGSAISSESKITLQNSLVLGNAGTSEIDGTIEGSNNFVGGTAGAPPAAFVFDAVAITGGGVLAMNGGLVPTVALRDDYTNPALDAGADNLAPPTDARGIARSDFGGAANAGANISDLGAFEVSAGRAPLLDAPDLIGTVTGASSLVPVSASIPGDGAIALSSSDPAHGSVSRTADGTLVYTPDEGYVGSDSFVVIATGANGATASATVSVVVESFADAGEFKLLATDGFIGGVGGNGTVFGTSARQQITVANVPGAVSFAGFAGNDEVRLAGDLADWSVARQGSNVVLTDGDTFVALPVRPDAITVRFDNGDLAVGVDVAAGVVKAGSQTITADLFVPLAATPQVIAPTGVGDPEAIGQLQVVAGGEAHVSGRVSVFGTSSAETVILGTGRFDFDPSFNGSGDIIRLPGDIDDYALSTLGSSLKIDGEFTDAIVPVGPGLTNIQFGETGELLLLTLNDARTMITLDGQAITAMSLIG